MENVMMGISNRGGAAMYAWETIEKSLDFIEEHLTEEIATDSLAGSVGMSPFYFQRLFKRLVKRPVQEYIKLRRLAKTVEALKNPGQRILDVAMEYGFSSHANFTRAFKETYGITPEEQKKNPRSLNRFERPELSVNYVYVDEGVPLVIRDIVLEICRKVQKQPETYLGFESEVNMSQQLPVGESTGIDVPGETWNKYHSEKNTIASCLDPNLELGMMYPKDMSKGIFLYFAGGFAKSIPEKPENGFMTKQLPAGEYIVCRIEAENFEELVTHALNQASRYLYDTWLPHHCLKTDAFSAEKYYRNTEEGACMEIWVKILQN